MAQPRPRYNTKEQNAEMLKRFRLWRTAQHYVPNTVEKYCGICKRAPERIDFPMQRHSHFANCRKIPVTPFHFIAGH